MPDSGHCIVPCHVVGKYRRRVGNTVSEELHSHAGVVVSVAEDFGGGESNRGADVAEFVGGFHAAHEAGVEQDVVHVHGDRLGKVLQ